MLNFDGILFKLHLAPTESLLESILSKEACKTGLPSLDQLLDHRFFTQYATEAAVTSEKPHFKVSLVSSVDTFINKLINLQRTPIAASKGAATAGCFEE